MTIQETSLNAYYSEIKPHLGERQKIIYEEIADHDDITNSEISVSLDIPINSVTPRVKELRNLGLVIDNKRRTCRVTGRTVIAWRITRLTLF